MNKNEKGFTLVELLVVVAIIGLLSTLAVVALGSARAKARDAKRVSDMRQIATALELYFNDNDSYPGVTSSIVLGGASSDTFSEDNGFDASGAGTVYMGAVPAAPTPPGGQTYEYLSLEGDGVTACPSEPCASYRIDFELEGTSTGLSGPLKMTPEGIQAQ